MRTTRTQLTDVGAERSARFRAALSGARLTAADWARQQSVTPHHLSLVILEKRVSLTLTAKIDAFIAEQVAVLAKTG